MLTFTDGALRTIILLHTATLGFSALEIAAMFMLYELAGMFTNQIPAGAIGIAIGLKGTRTGDTLVEKGGDLGNVVLGGLRPPPPVFTAAIDASTSLSRQNLTHS